MSSGFGVSFTSGSFGSTAVGFGGGFTRIIVPGPGPDPGPNVPQLGTEVAWSDNTYFDFWTSQSGVTTTDVTGSNGLTYQLCYAHKTISIPSDGVNRIGVNTFTTQTAAPKPIRFVSGSNNSQISNFGGEKSLVGLNSIDSAPGKFIEQPCSSATTIQAGSYFIIGIGAIFFRTMKTVTTNRTAMLGGEPVVTVIPTNWWSSQANVQTSGFPTELGGTRTPTQKFTDKVLVMSIKFDVV